MKRLNSVEDKNIQQLQYKTVGKVHTVMFIRESCIHILGTEKSPLLQKDMHRQSRNTETAVQNDAVFPLFVFSYNF